MTEAERILSNMCTTPSYHGTTTVDVVDEFFKRFTNPVMCNGEARKAIFTRITPNTYEFRTEPL